MKKIIWGISLLLISAPTMLPQKSQPENSHPQTSFLINKRLPFVYLTLEHVGPRIPLNVNEPKLGIWFRLHNNCNVPIMVDTFGDPIQEGLNGAIVFDRVVLNSPPLGELGSVVVDGPHEMAKPDPSFLGGLPSKKIDKNDENAKSSQEEKMPYGYIFTNASTTIISPGKNIYFSFPIDHINKTWHLEISFRLKFDNTVPMRDPSNFVSFYWDDLPDSYRRTYESQPVGQVH